MPQGISPNPLNKISEVYLSQISEHHKKDVDGNTIPHEGEDVDEARKPMVKVKLKDPSKIKVKVTDIGPGGKEYVRKNEMDEGAGLYANIHAKRKRGGKMRKKGDKGAPSSQDFANAARTAKEETDLFDSILNHYVNEGYDEKDVIQAMSSLTEEQLQEVGPLAALAPLLGKIGAGAAAGKVAAGAATKGALAAKSAKIASAAGTAGKTAATTTQAAKPLTGIAKQSFTAPSVTPPKPMVNAPTQSKVTTSGGKTAPGTDLKNLKDKNKNLLTKAKDSFNKMSPTEKLLTVNMGASMLPRGGGGATQQQKVGTVSASADLFDIVKGQLIDEGCTEEEIKEIMTTLTPEEIMNEMAVNPKIAAMDAKNKADMIKRAKAKEVPQDVRDAAKRQYKAGTPREDPNNPYTTADKKKIINQYKDN